MFILVVIYQIDIDVSFEYNIDRLNELRTLKRAMMLLHRWYWDKISVSDWFFPSTGSSEDLHAFCHYITSRRVEENDNAFKTISGLDAIRQHNSQQQIVFNR